MISVQETWSNTHKGIQTLAYELHISRSCDPVTTKYLLLSTWNHHLSTDEDNLLLNKGLIWLQDILDVREDESLNLHEGLVQHDFNDLLQINNLRVATHDHQVSSNAGVDLPWGVSEDFLQWSADSLLVSAVKTTSSILEKFQYRGGNFQAKISISEKDYW